MFTWCTAGGSWASSDTSWRNAPRNTVITQLLLLCAILLFCLGLLLGSSWTLQAVQLKLRRQAEERRKLDEEWSALRKVRR